MKKTNKKPTEKEIAENKRRVLELLSRPGAYISEEGTSIVIPLIEEIDKKPERILH